GRGGRGTGGRGDNGGISEAQGAGGGLEAGGRWPPAACPAGRCVHLRLPAKPVQPLPDEEERLSMGVLQGQERKERQDTSPGGNGQLQCILPAPARPLPLERAAYGSRRVRALPAEWL